MKKSKYKVYVYEAYTKVYEVRADSEIDAIVKIEKNGERMNEVQISIIRSTNCNLISSYLFII